MQRAVVRTTIIACAIALASANGQVTRPTNDDIVQELMPSGVPTDLAVVSESEKPLVILRLRTAQAVGSGKRSQQLAFLLANLGSEYNKNRDFLVRELQGCANQSRTCDEDTAAFVIALYARGDSTVLQPLLNAGLHSDAALSEILGTFYADVLTKKTLMFLSHLRKFRPSDQRSLCNLAGGRDGGGMPPEELAALRTRLKQLGGPSAHLCAEGVESANKPE